MIVSPLGVMCVVFISCPDMAALGLLHTDLQWWNRDSNYDEHVHSARGRGGKGTNRNSWVVVTFNVSWRIHFSSPLSWGLSSASRKASSIHPYFFYHPRAVPSESFLYLSWAISISPARIIAESCTSLIHISTPGQVSCVLPNSSAWRCAVFSFVWKKIGNMSEKCTHILP